MATITASFTPSSAPSELGNTNKIGTIKATITNFISADTTYIAIVSFGNYSYRSTYTLITSDTITIEHDIFDCHLPNATSGTCTVGVDFKTPDGYSSGYVSKKVTVNIPSWVKPTVTYSKISTVASGAPESFGYVQNNSKAKLEAHGRAYGGATVSSVTLSCPGAGFNYTKSFSGTTAVASSTTGLLTKSGGHTFTITVKDSRGRSYSTKKNITVQAYANPVIGSLTADRCNASAIITSTGTYAKAIATFSCTSLNGNNSIKSAILSYKVNGASAFAEVGTISSGSYSSIFGDGNLELDKEHYVRVTVTDTIGKTSIRNFTILGTSYIIDVLNGGTGLGLGCEATTSGQLDIGYVANFKQAAYCNNHLTFANNKYISFTGTDGSSTWQIGISKAGNAHLLSQNNYQGNLTIGHENVQNTYINGQYIKLCGKKYAGANVTVSGDCLYPDVTNAVNLGTGSYRWMNCYVANTVYAGTGSINTSDMRKKEIVDDTMSHAHDLIMGLETYSCKYKGDLSTSGRVHDVLSAQNLRDVLYGLGIDRACFTAQPNDDNKPLEECTEDELTYGIRYTELIPPIIKVIQEFESRISALESER